MPFTFTFSFFPSPVFISSMLLISHSYRGIPPLTFSLAISSSVTCVGYPPYLSFSSGLPRNCKYVRCPFICPLKSSSFFLSRHGLASRAHVNFFLLPIQPWKLSGNAMSCGSPTRWLVTAIASLPSLFSPGGTGLARHIFLNLFSQADPS